MALHVNPRGYGFVTKGEISDDQAAVDAATAKRDQAQAALDRGSSDIDAKAKKFGVDRDTVIRLGKNASKELSSLEAARDLAIKEADGLNTTVGDMYNNSMGLDAIDLAAFRAHINTPVTAEFRAQYGDGVANAVQKYQGCWNRLAALKAEKTRTEAKMAAVREYGCVMGAYSDLLAKRNAAQAELTDANEELAADRSSFNKRMDMEAAAANTASGWAGGVSRWFKGIADGATADRQ